MNTLQRFGLFGLFGLLIGLFEAQTFPPISSENILAFEFILFFTCASAIVFVLPPRA